MRQVQQTVLVGLQLIIFSMTFSMSVSMPGMAQSIDDVTEKSGDLTQNNTTDSCSLTMGWEPWNPYQYIENDKLTGFDIELISAIFENMDCSISFKQINWARGLVEVRAGKLDLLPHADFTEERAKWAVYSDSYRDASQVLYVKKGYADKFPLQQLKDIASTGFRLGVGRGVFIGDEFSELIKNASFEKQVYYIPTDEMQQYQMLQADRIDGYIRSITAIDTLETKLGESLNLEIHPLHILTSRQHVIFSQVTVDKNLVEQFNRSLAKLMSDGKYQTIEKTFLK